MYDTIIIGAGPAGLQAAIVLAFDGLKVLLLDKAEPGGQILQSPLIENVGGWVYGFSGRHWAEQAALQAVNVGARLLCGEEHCVIQTVRAEGGYRVQTQDTVYASKSLILATGCSPHILRVPGGNLQGVHYSMVPGHCPVSKKVVVVGGRNSAATAAMYLAEIGNEVHLIHRSDPHMSAGIVRRWHHVDRMRDTITGITNDGDSLIVHLSRGFIDDVSDVFVMAGRYPDVAFAESIYRTDENGHVRPGFEAWTGAFVIGDCRADCVRTMGAAIGSGTEIVPSVHHYLKGN